MIRHLAIVIAVFMLLSAVIGGATFTITEGYQRAYDKMVLTDGGTVFPTPKVKAAAAPRADEEPQWNILTPLR